MFVMTWVCNGEIMEIIKLSKEYTFEDYPSATELKLELDGMKGSDILEVSDLLQAQGHVAVQPSLDTKTQAALAARALDLPLEYVNGLPLPDFMKVCQKVQNFLLM